MEFPEGPAFDGRDGIALSNCTGDYISRITLSGRYEKRWITSESTGPGGFRRTNGMTFDRAGNLWVCDFEKAAIVRISPDRKAEVIADTCSGERLKGPNDLAFDRAGNLYFTDPGGSSRENPVGSVYRLDARTRGVSRLATGFAFPNGIAFSPDARHLYVCESQHNRVLRFTVNRDGTLGQQQNFCDLKSAGEGQPDGMAVDTKGNLWITHYGAHQVVIADSAGSILETIRLPHKKDQGPTNIEFAGKDLKTVYITDPGDDCTWKLTSRVAGLRLLNAPNPVETMR
jgi:gluconolactonase